MAGVVARAGAWEDLYPIPTNPNHNPGDPADSRMRPRYAELANREGVGESFRFIQPPPNAVLFLPLGFLTLAQAHWLWFALAAGCIWGVGLQAAAIHRRLAARASRWQGGLVLLVCCSFLAQVDLAEGNMSSLVALCIGAAVLDLMQPRGRGAVGSIAIVFGTVTKYAAGVLLPLYALLGRWRTLGWAAGITFAWTGVTLALAGTGPFRTFFREIAPTLGRSFAQPGNQSLQGVLLRATRVDALPYSAAIAFRCVAALSLAAILVLCWRARRSYAIGEPRVLVPAGACLVAWLLLFSPIYWAHYALYLCPFWGWMIWQARRTVSRVAVGLALAVMAFPVGGVTTYQPPQWLAALLCWGTLLTFAITFHGFVGEVIAVGSSERAGREREQAPMPAASRQLFDGNLRQDLAEV
jgi:hypothetical protein